MWSKIFSHYQSDMNKTLKFVATLKEPLRALHGAVTARNNFGLYVRNFCSLPNNTAVAKGWNARLVSAKLLNDATVGQLLQIRLKEGQRDSQTDIYCEVTRYTVFEIFVVVRVKGQSFMLHQIRKMIGLAIAVVRGIAGGETIVRAFGTTRIDIPKAPGLGLLLEEVHYDKYNDKYGGDGVHEPIVWEAKKAAIDEFKHKHIYPVIADTERQEMPMFEWLQTLVFHTYDEREQKANERLSEGVDVSERGALWRAHSNVLRVNQGNDGSCDEKAGGEETNGAAKGDDIPVVLVVGAGGGLPGAGWGLPGAGGGLPGAGGGLLEGGWVHNGTEWISDVQLGGKRKGGKGKGVPHKKPEHRQVGHDSKESETVATEADHAFDRLEFFGTGTPLPETANDIKVFCDFLSSTGGLSHYQSDMNKTLKFVAKLKEPLRALHGAVTARNNFGLYVRNFCSLPNNTAVAKGWNARLVSAKLLNDATVGQLLQIRLKEGQRDSQTGIYCVLRSFAEQMELTHADPPELRAFMKGMVAVIVDLADTVEKSKVGWRSDYKCELETDQKVNKANDRLSEGVDVSERGPLWRAHSNVLHENQGNDGSCDEKAGGEETKGDDIPVVLVVGTGEGFNGTAPVTSDFIFGAKKPGKGNRPASAPGRVGHNRLAFQIVATEADHAFDRLEFFGTGTPLPETANDIKEFCGFLSGDWGQYHYQSDMNKTLKFVVKLKEPLKAMHGAVVARNNLGPYVRNFCSIPNNMAVAKGWNARLVSAKLLNDATIEQLLQTRKEVRRDSQTGIYCILRSFGEQMELIHADPPELRQFVRGMVAVIVDLADTVEKSQVGWRSDNKCELADGKFEQSQLRSILYSALLAMSKYF
ncbi:unnamed protein product [Oppiella nova]|uniref:Pseudouridine synthase I TruA alpha/beta domain-containing protein n=1 Tax=Oppiella nova TaxID=334625 RepID=A0A7R9QJ09_9ACAR|nr:unnamed protein product [Oppiella nova]CAG2166923.1 unnamed protein product [Oppiella nova]